MNILITGGAGFIGSHLVDKLSQTDNNLSVIDNLHRGKIGNIKEHIDSKRIAFYEEDIRSYEEIRSKFSGIDVVYHLAAQSNVLGAVADMDYSYETNVTGTFNVLKSSLEAGVKRVIFSSSREAYGEAQYLPVDETHPLNSKNIYGASKAAGEIYCRVFRNMADMEVVIFRLSNVYGTRDFGRVIPIFFENAAQNKDFMIFGKDKIIDFVSVEIVVDAFVKAMMLDGVQDETAVNIGSGKGTSLIELGERIVKMTNTKAKLVIKETNKAEVNKFIAKIDKFKALFNFKPPDDPLYFLDEMV